VLKQGGGEKPSSEEKKDLEGPGTTQEKKKEADGKGHSRKKGVLKAVKKNSAKGGKRGKAGAIGGEGGGCLPSSQKGEMLPFVKEEGAPLLGKKGKKGKEKENLKRGPKKNVRGSEKKPSWAPHEGKGMLSKGRGGRSVPAESIAPKTHACGGEEENKVTGREGGTKEAGRPKKICF